MLTLLTKGDSSAKLAKDSEGVLTAILYLASGQFDSRLCPAAGACKKAELGLCLVLNSGHTGLSKPDAETGAAAAKINRTKLYFESPEGFKFLLRLELRDLERRAAAKGLKPAARLNGGSDLDWIDIYNEFPNIQFWEYTKRPDLALKLAKLPNVSVTYSYSETTSERTFKAIVEAGINIAVVFNTRKGKSLPELFKGMPVIDGDASDLRFRDSKGLVIGLRFKSAKDRDQKRKAGVEAGFIQAA